MTHRSRAAGTSATPEIAGQKPRVLLVDDSPSQRKLDQSQFEQAELDVSVAASAEEALELLGTLTPDVIVSDVLIADMGGFELCRRIRAAAATAQVPVVLVSIYEDEDERDRVQAQDAGATALVLRGRQPQELVEAALAAMATGSAPLPVAAGPDTQSNTQRLVELLESHVVSKRAVEHELMTAESLFQQLVDAVTDYAIFMLDAQGHVATWNSGAAKNKGYVAHEIIGRHFSVFYTPEDVAAGKPDHILRTVRREGRFEDEGWRVRKDGTRFWANVVITILKGHNGEITGFAKVTRDLTAKRVAEENERKLIREQLARAAAEASHHDLERASRMKDEFLATISHELRTPLNAILGWAVLLKQKPRAEDKLERGLDVIERNAQAQARLVSDLLDVSRIMSGKLQLQLAKTEIFPIMFAAADVVRPAAEAKGVRLVVDVDPSLGPTLADPDRLQQVVWNLLTNAVRFTPRGGRVTLTGDRTASGIEICVRDTGAGIDREHLPHLFDRFRQVDSSTTRAHGGLGLGLSIVRQLVEAHGGAVDAHSGGLGQGAAFTVKLPIRAVSTAPHDATPAPGDAIEAPSVRAEPNASIQDVRVLIVDDNEDSLEVLREVLERAGAQVTAASSARQALAAIDADPSLQLIISDIGMPEVDGYAFMRLVRAKDPSAKIPAIALTAYTRPSDAELARRAGFQQHLAKPVDEPLLLRAVKAWSSAGAGGRGPLLS